MGSLEKADNVLFVSDLHYGRGHWKGIDESVAPKWLSGIIEKHNPDIMISLGDNGYAWSKSEIRDLTKKVKFLTIYGNHDNARLLSEIKNQDGTPVHVNDGEIRNIGGLRFGFINGIVATTPSLPLEKTREKFLEIGERLRWKGVDVLCTHESPTNSKTKYRVGAGAMKDMLMSMDQFVLSLSGHTRPALHGRRIINNTINFTLDSSQRSKYYAVFNIPNRKITLWLDRMQIGSRVDVNSFVGRVTVATLKACQKTPHLAETAVLQIANRSDERKAIIDTSAATKLQETTFDSIEEIIKKEARKETTKMATLTEIGVDREITLQERIKEHAKERLSDLLRIRDDTTMAVVVLKGKGILNKIKK